MTLASWILKTSVDEDPTASLDYLLQGCTTCSVKNISLWTNWTLQATIAAIASVTFSGTTKKGFGTT